MERFLTIRVWSAFVVDEKGKIPRWGKEVTRDNVIAHAVAKVPKFHRLSKTPSNKLTGEMKIDINGIINPFILRLDPPPVSLCDQPAGPLLEPPKEKLEGQFGVMAKRRYRPLEIEVFPEKGKVAFSPRPRVVQGMTHGRVIRPEKFDGFHLDIDWKPDWVTVKPGDPRDNALIQFVGDSDPKHARKASELLAAGRWAIVLHRTDERSIGSSLNHFMVSGKSSHYIIDLDGHVIKLVDDRRLMSGHAGTNAQWMNEQPVNAFSIGIEIVNAIGDAFTHAQMASLISLLDKLRKAYKIPPDRVLAHCEVRPLEKDHTNPKLNCPGFEFEWPILEKNGHALYPSFREDIRYPPGFDEFFLTDIDDALMYPNSDKGRGKYGLKNRSLDSARNDLIVQLQRNLLRLGYENLLKDESGEFGVLTERVVQRFQGRYMTGQRYQFLGDDQKYLGKANSYTLAMMQAVLAARGMEWRSAS